MICSRRNCGVTVIMLLDSFWTSARFLPLWPVLHLSREWNERVKHGSEIFQAFAPAALETCINERRDQVANGSFCTQIKMGSSNRKKNEKAKDFKVRLLQGHAQVF